MLRKRKELEKNGLGPEANHVHTYYFVHAYRVSTTRIDISSVIWCVCSLNDDMIIGSITITITTY